MSARLSGISVEGKIKGRRQSTIKISLSSVLFSKSCLPFVYSLFFFLTFSWSVNGGQWDGLPKAESLWIFAAAVLVLVLPRASCSGGDGRSATSTPRPRRHLLPPVFTPDADAVVENSLQLLLAGGVSTLW